jgi:hypothetical protein
MTASQVDKFLALRYDVRTQWRESAYPVIRERWTDPDSVLVRARKHPGSIIRLLPELPARHDCSRICAQRGVYTGRAGRHTVRKAATEKVDSSPLRP